MKDNIFIRPWRHRLHIKSKLSQIIDLVNGQSITVLENIYIWTVLKFTLHNHNISLFDDIKK